MAFKRNGVWYIDRHYRGVGRVKRSLGTKTKRRADRLESVIDSLFESGRLDLLQLFAQGQVSVQEIETAYDKGSTGTLVQALNTIDVDIDYAVAEFLRNRRAEVRPMTLQRYADSLKHLVRLSETDTTREVLTTDALVEFKARRVGEGVARETINNDLIAASALSTFAVNRGWADRRPHISKFKTERRVRWLTQEQWESYIHAVPERHQPLMRLLVGTGLRLGEALALRPVDVETHRVRVAASKSPSGIRYAFVPEGVKEELHKLSETLTPEHRIFSVQRSGVNKAHKKACTEVSIVDYRVHDHRHTFAVWCAQAGMPLSTIARQLGHSTVAQTEVYATFHPEYERDVARYFDKFGII